MKEFTTPVRVIYAHTDQMGIVNNSRYLEYFEIGRTEFIRSLGLSYKEFEEKGYMLPLIEAKIKFIKQARYDAVLNVRAFIPEKPAARLKIHYEIFEGSNLLTEGYTTHAFVRSDNFRPTRAPEFFVKLLED